jgi:hypothetical protein
MPGVCWGNILLSLFICYNKINLRSVIFNQWDRMQGLGYREDWKYPQRETVAFCVLKPRMGMKWGGIR